MYKYIYWTKLGEDRRSFDRDGNLSGEGGESCPVILFFPPGQTSPLRTCVCRRRYRPPARLELRNCRCPAAYLDPSNFRKQAGSWPQKGGWSFRGTLSKTCRSDTSRRERSSNSGRRNDPNFPREYRRGSINRFVRRPIPPTDSRFSRTRPLRLFLSLTRIRSYGPACKCHARRSDEISFLSRYGPANFLIALSRGLVSLTTVLLLAHGSSLSGSPFLPRARIGRETRELCRSPPRE